MKERPIIFSTPTVQAILEGRKTMTRRTSGLNEINKSPDDWHFEWADFSLKKPWRFTQLSTVNEKTLADRSFTQSEIKCPYGNLNDILWVKETVFPVVIDDYDGNGNEKFSFWYKADNIDENLKNNYEDSRWIPSIYMPKVACRIFLEITKITVRRLNDITEEDAIREGIEIIDKHPDGFTYKSYIPGLMENFACPIASFESLWNSINIKKYPSWDNPWVWVIEFKRIDQ